MRTRDAHRLIRRAERQYIGRNITRWYSTVHPKRNGEATIKTWAVKTWKGSPLIMLASEYNTDGSQNYVSGRCLINNYLNSRCFNWLDYGGRPHISVWSDIDGPRNEWFEACDHRFGKGHEFFGRMLNGFENTKYRYCGFENTHMRVSDFLDCYKVSPLTELLAKSGLHRWLTPSHISRLKDSKPLARFVAHNSRHFTDVSPSVIYRQFAKDGERTDVFQIAALATLAPFNLHKLAIAPKRIYRWMLDNGVEASALRHHVDNLKELQMSTAYEPHVLPHDWATYSLDIEDRVAEARELQIARDMAIVREARRFAVKTINRWLAEGRIKKKYRIVFPQSQTELTLEGEVMSNCLSRYLSKIQKGESTIAFIRKGNKPYIDIEIGKDGTLIQSRYAHNIAVKPKSVDGRLCRLVASAFKPNKRKRKAA